MPPKVAPLFCLWQNIDEFPFKRTRVLEYMHRFLGTNHTVLVHCHAGIQRSCAVVACYLVEYHGLTPDEAIEHIKDKRHVAFITGVNFKDTVEGVYNRNFMTK